ncbi:DUF6990 domain-containing protein [Roseibium salinum]|uniref:DUF6990 domain-containing protein n=1 Tax=Roseibium salinum TaxID=1604349 RepID=UPI00361B1AC4
MKTKEVTQLLKTLGWHTYTDEVGDKFSLFHLPDRVVDLGYGIRKYGREQQLEADVTASTEASCGCKAIDPGHRRYAPLVRRRRGLCYQVPAITEEHVRRASDESIAWAQAQDLDKALRDHAALPTNAPGARPIWHLAALALLGDVAKLKFYQASFEAGDRLGFVNYVTKDYIDRTVSFAERLAARG